METELMVDEMNLQVKHAIKKFGEQQPWNHNFILADNIETRPGDFKSPAKNKNKLVRLEEIFDAVGLNKKTVFDVGCNEGYFSVEMAKRGATVTGLDIDELRIEKAKFVTSLIARNLPIEYICANFLEDDVELNQADIVLCLGFLHRVPDPISAVGKLAQMGKILIFEWKAHNGGSSGYPSATFTRQPINHADTYGTEYWLLSVDALKRILLRYGFENTYLLENNEGKREILVASKQKINGINLQNERIRSIKTAVTLAKETLRVSLQALKPNM